jgi:hypothetical protein
MPKLRWNKSLIIAYKNTFESPEGKIVLEDLKKRAPMLTEGLKVTGGIDVNSLLVLEGRSDVIKYIYKMLKRDPNEEAVERAKIEQRNI